MKKSTRNILIVTGLLALVAVVFIMTRSKNTFDKDQSDFAVDDTSNVVRIFMSDKDNHTLNLSRAEAGKWMVNETYNAATHAINMLLQTIVDLQVKEPVAKAAYNTVIRNMAASSVKVEIYQEVYRIDLFGFIRWFPHEKKTKVYYVGGATPSNRGTYMLIEGSDVPYVVYLPGLRGFVSPRYSPVEKYWRDYTVFKKALGEIRSVTVEIPSMPQESYTIENSDNRFAVYSFPDRQGISPYDTIAVLNFMVGFRNLNFEALLNDMDAARKDSILQSVPFFIVTVIDTAGMEQTVKMYRKPAAPGEVDMNGKQLPYDMDRLYALVNNGQDFTLIQYYVFDRVLRPKSFFLPDK